MTDKAPERIYIHHADQIKVDGTQCLVFTSPAPVNFTGNQTPYVPAALLDSLSRGNKAMLARLHELNEPVLPDYFGAVADGASDCTDAFNIAAMQATIMAKSDLLDEAVKALEGMLEFVKDEGFCYCIYPDHTEPADAGEEVDAARATLAKIKETP